MIDKCSLVQGWKQVYINTGNICLLNIRWNTIETVFRLTYKNSSQWIVLWQIYNTQLTFIQWTKHIDTPARIYNISSFCAILRHCNLCPEICASFVHSWVIWIVVVWVVRCHLGRLNYKVYMKFPFMPNFLV